MVKEALDYVQWDDVPVFPVAVTKAPLTPNGFKDATRDPAAVRELWRKHPEAGIGVPTGRASGWLVIDVDPRHGGDAALAELAEQYGPLPETLTARTGGGGWHFAFQCPQGVEIRNSAGKLGQGIDVRGEGGYVIVPPSLHESGRRYEWTDCPGTPAPLPEWLLTLLTTEPGWVAGASGAKPRPQPKSGAAIPPLIPDGRRGEALFKIGCSLRGKGGEYPEIEAELLKINALRCVPPKHDKEVQKIARSVMRYAPNAAAAGV